MLILKSLSYASKNVNEVYWLIHAWVEAQKNTASRTVNEPTGRRAAFFLLMNLGDGDIFFLHLGVGYESLFRIHFKNEIYLPMGFKAKHSQ